MSQDPQVSGLSPGQDLPAQHLVRRLWIPEFSCLKPSHMLFPRPRRLTLPCSPSSHPPVLQIQDSDRSLLPTLGHAVLPHLPPAFSSWNSLQGGQWIHFCAWDHTIPWRDMSPTKPRHCFAGCWMVGLSTLLGTQHPMRQVLPSLRSRPNSQVRERSNRFHNITRRHSVTSGLGQRHSSSPLMATEVVREQDGPGRRPRVDMGQGENATKVNFQTELKSWFRILGGTSGETLRTIAYDWSSLIQVTELTKKKKKNHLASCSPGHSVSSAPWMGSGKEASLLGRRWDGILSLKRQSYLPKHAFHWYPRLIIAPVVSMVNSPVNFKTSLQSLCFRELPAFKLFCQVLSLHKFSDYCDSVLRK